MVQHVALEIIESDIQNFYINILEGTIKKEFEVNADTSGFMFEIYKPISVIMLQALDFNFELFVRNKHGYKSEYCAHIAALNTGTISEKVKRSGFLCRLRKKNGFAGWSWGQYRKRNKSYNHICIVMSDAHLLYERAKQNGYWCRVWNSYNDAKTFFIRDKNGNTFELKQKSIYG